MSTTFARILARGFQLDPTVHADWTDRFDGSVSKIKKHAGDYYAKHNLNILPENGAYIFSKTYVLSCSLKISPPQNDIQIQDKNH